MGPSINRLGMRRQDFVDVLIGKPSVVQSQYCSVGSSQSELLNGLKRSAGVHIDAGVKKDASLMINGTENLQSHNTVGLPSFSVGNDASTSSNDIKIKSVGSTQNLVHSAQKMDV